jgi:hypothetical protein
MAPAQKARWASVAHGGGSEVSGIGSDKAQAFGSWKEEDCRGNPRTVGGVPSSVKEDRTCRIRARMGWWRPSGHTIGFPCQN